MKNSKIGKTNEDGTKQVTVHESHRDINMEYRPVGDPKKPKELILSCKYSCGQLFLRKADKQNHESIVHPDSSKLKIKPLVFNTAGVTDEENAPTAAASYEAGGENERSETEHEPYEASKNSGKEPGFYFLDMDFCVKFDVSRSILVR